MTDRALMVLVAAAVLAAGAAVVALARWLARDPAAYATPQRHLELVVNEPRVLP